MADRLTLRLTASQASVPGRKQYRNSLPFVASEHPEIAFIYSDHRMLRIEFAHANNAQISKIRPTVVITARQFGQLLQITGQVEGHSQHLAPHQGQDIGTRAQMKGGLGQHRLTGDYGLSDVLGNVYSPCVMMVSLIAERHDEASVGDGLHRREKPFRDDKSDGPLILPARFRKC